MLEIIDHIQQGSDEWFREKIGSIGGSSIGKIAAKGEGKQRKQMLFDMAGEIISGAKKVTFSNGHMENGTAFEEECRDYYCLQNDCEIKQVALIRDQPHKHYSPDGLKGEDGLIEIKCVIPSVFIEYKLTGTIPTGYRRQMQWGLKRTGRSFCDYTVYCRDFVGKCDPMIVKRVERDEKEIRILEDEADIFIEDLMELVEKIRG